MLKVMDLVVFKQGYLLNDHKNQLLVSKKNLGFLLNKLDELLPVDL